MLKQALLSLFLLTYWVQIAVSQADSITAPIVDNQLSKEILADLANGKLPAARAATNLTFIGEYLKA